MHNLIQMRAALDSADQYAEHEIFNYSVEAIDAVSSFLTLAFLHRQMTCAVDRETVRSELPDSLSIALGSLDDNIKATNEELAILTSRAALAEGERIRDALQSIRAGLSQVSY